MRGREDCRGTGKNLPVNRFSSRRHALKRGRPLPEHHTGNRIRRVPRGSRSPDNRHRAPPDGNAAVSTDGNSARTNNKTVAYLRTVPGDSDTHAVRTLDYSIGNLAALACY